MITKRQASQLNPDQQDRPTVIRIERKNEMFSGWGVRF
jgi:hypothetical protein